GRRRPDSSVVMTTPRAHDTPRLRRQVPRCGLRDRTYARLVRMLLRIARNPDPGSRLPYLLYVPLGTGLVFRTSDVWPRTKALYCHPVPVEEWPDQPEIVEEVPLRSCARRGAAIDLVLDRGRENRS